MADSTFSASWYRVAELKPRLRPHARLHRHRYRGNLWYVLEDLSSERYHRFTPTAYSIIVRMDGNHTVAEIWEAACAELGDDAPTQDELIQLLSQLHLADALASDTTPDVREMLERARRQKKSRVVGQLLSPLFWRVPLYDPERFLTRALPYVRPLFSRLGAVLWLAVVGTGVGLVTVHWTDLSEGMVDRILAPKNLILVWLIFPIIKAIHEFGHAFATKAFGGEVHEMGIMMLVLTPLPYVDASSASSFRMKRHRVIVGAAGMIVEVFCASIAMMIWASVEPGVVRQVAFNTVFIGGVSTLLFNINPLLRFDGYYILSDLIEIPNLRARSTRQLAFIGERYLLGNADANPPESTPGERIWFVVFGCASFVYRVVIVTGIILFIASRFFFIGVVLALYSLIGWVVLPISRGLRKLLSSPRLRSHRGRTVGVIGGGVLLLVVLTCFVPAPLNTISEGVIWVPDNSIVRMGTDGFVDEIVTSPGERVEVGDVLLACSDPVLLTRRITLEGRLAELEAAYTVEWIRDPVQAEVVREELEHVKESLVMVRAEEEELVVRAAVPGCFVMPNHADTVGRYVPRGTPVARVIDLSSLTARVIVDQSDVDLVRSRTREVEVRLAERQHEVSPARLQREVPAASERLPSTALGMHGGGQVATDPRDSQGVQALAKVFQFDIELSPADVVNVGGRVFVRFRHGWEPVSRRWYRSARQLFMRHFSL